MEDRRERPEQLARRRERWYNGVSEGVAGDHVREIATIRNASVFEHWGRVEARVVLTDERIAHIRAGHEEDYQAFGDRIEEVIEAPTYILDDAKNASTALFIKHFQECNINVVVRLIIRNGGSDELCSSVITMYRLGDKTLTRLLKKNKVLYSACGM